jgi:hypothetical protein
VLRCARSDRRTVTRVVALARSRAPAHDGRVGSVPVALRSGSHKRNRRVEVGVVLAVVALVAGGSVGVLVAILLVLFVLDAIIPVPAAPTAQADERFRRLVRLRRQAARRRRARGLAPERLDVLDDRIGWASVAERRDLGVLPIAIASITGTVEDDKARAFDRELRPDRSCREHWTGLWLAQARGIALPPVSVYRVEDAHFLRDGHHRASVACDQGFATIDAEVVELRRAHHG